MIAVSDTLVTKMTGILETVTLYRLYVTCSKMYEEYFVITSLFMNCCKDDHQPYTKHLNLYLFQ